MAASKSDNRVNFTMFGLRKQGDMRLQGGFAELVGSWGLSERESEKGGQSEKSGEKSPERQADQTFQEWR